MKSTKNLKSALMGLLAVTSLTACGSLPSAMTSTVASAASDGSSLSTLAVDGDSAATASPGPGGHGKGGPGGREMGGKAGPGGREMGGKAGPGGHGGPGGFGFMNPRALADLELSDAQKTQIEALQTEAKAFMEANKPTQASASPPSETDREAARAAFEAAFKSDHFDASDLTANRPARPAQSDTMLDFQVDQIIKLHDILTADQRAKLAAGPDQANAPTDRHSPPADALDHETARLDQLATELSLSEAQKSEFAALFSAEAAERQSEMASRKAAMETERAAYASLLTADTIDRAALKAAISARFDKAPDADGPAAQLVAIHDILNADQRAQWLELKQAGFGPGPGGHPGPGGPGGRGGHGGPGGFGGPQGAPAQ